MERTQRAAYIKPTVEKIVLAVNDVTPTCSSVPPTDCQEVAPTLGFNGEPMES